MSGVVYAPVDRLVAVLGIVAALRFAERFGGRRVYVPQPERIKPEGPVVATIGYDAAVRLAQEWRGLEIMVPLCAAYVRQQRDRAIHAEPQQMSVADVAGKYGITERHAFRILASEPPEAAESAASSAQPSLFPES